MLAEVATALRVCCLFCVFQRGRGCHSAAVVGAIAALTVFCVCFVRLVVCRCGAPMCVAGGRASPCRGVCEVVHNEPRCACQLSASRSGSSSRDHCHRRQLLEERQRRGAVRLRVLAVVRTTCKIAIILVLCVRCCVRVFVVVISLVAVGGWCRAHVVQLAARDPAMLNVAAAFGTDLSNIPSAMEPLQDQLPASLLKFEKWFSCEVSGPHSWARPLPAVFHRTCMGSLSSSSSLMVVPC